MKDTFTVDNVMSWEPCYLYDRLKVVGLFAGRKELDVPGLLAIDIPEIDKVWVISKLAEVEDIKPALMELVYSMSHCLSSDDDKKLFIEIYESRDLHRARSMVTRYLVNARYTTEEYFIVDCMRRAVSRAVVNSGDLFDMEIAYMSYDESRKADCLARILGVDLEHEEI